MDAPFLERFGKLESQKTAPWLDIRKNDAPAQTWTPQSRGVVGSTTLVPGLCTFLGFRPLPFMPNDPELWVALLEHQFCLCGIVDQLTRFQLMSLAMDAPYVSAVRDAILNAPRTRPYEALRQAVLQRFRATGHELVTRLVDRLVLSEGLELPPPTRPQQANDAIRRSFASPPRRVDAGEKRSGRAAGALVVSPQRRASRIDLKTAKEARRAAAASSPRPSASPPRRGRSVSSFVSGSSVSQCSQSSSSSCSCVRNFFATRCSRSSEGSSTYSFASSVRGQPKSVCYYHRRFGAAARRCRRGCAYASKWL